ncbi:MAG: RseA family anti-sigma factor [Woeseia sp.]
MNDALKLQVSAFIDGELEAAEAEMLVRRLGQDAGLRQQAAAYLQIGRLLRGEQTVPAARDLAARIAAAVADEAPLAAAESAELPNRWLRPAAGFAIAASVALLALAGLRQLEAPELSAPANSQSAQLTEAGSYTEPLAIDVMADRPGDMLMQYYLSHGETSGELGANGILSRLVTLELRGGELVEVPATNDTALETALPSDENQAAESSQLQ